MADAIAVYPFIDPYAWHDDTFDSTSTQDYTTTGEVTAGRGLLGGTTSPLNPGSNCVGRWRLEDNLASTVVLDDVGSNNGTASENTSGLNTSGKFGDAFAFDGTDDYVEWTSIDGTELDPTSAMSLVLWFKTSTNQNNNTLVRTWGLSGTKIEIRIDDDSGSFEYRLQTTGGATVFSSTDQGNGYWADNAWHLVVATYDSSLGSERAKLYVDNVKVSNNNSDGNPLESSDKMYLGAGAPFTTEFTGSIDNFMFYDKALSEAEISALWNSGAGNESANYAAITLATIVGSTDIFTFYHASDIGTDVGIEGDLEVHEGVYAGGLFATSFGNYVGFDAPTLTSDTSWTLPNDDGSANQCMVTDGSEILSWAGHDDLAGFVANEHISWVDGDGATANFTTTGVGTFNSIDFPEIAQPANPASNKLRLYTEAIQEFSFLKYLDDTGMKREFMRDSMLLAYNNSGSTIAANRIVYADASTGTVPEIKLAKADSIATMPAIGVTVESIANGAYGRVMQVGILENINTSALSAGDVLYVSDSTAGVPVTTAPATPSLTQEVGTVLVDHASTGAIQIVARGLTGDEYGTAQNTFTIGDGTAGTKSLIFNAVTDAQIDWTETAFDFGSNNLSTSGTLGAGATTVTTLKTHAYAITSGSEISYKTATITPTLIGIVEVISDSSNLLPSGTNAGIDVEAYFDPDDSVTNSWQFAGSFFNYTTGTPASGAGVNSQFGLYGGCEASIVNNGNSLNLWGLSFGCFNNEDFDGGAKPPYSLTTHGIDIESYLGYDGKTISNEATVINYGAKLEAIIDGTYNSTVAGVNYGAYIQTTDSLTDIANTRAITSYGIYIDACADNTLGSGGILTSWGLVEANGRDNALKGNTRIGGITAPTNALSMDTASKIDFRDNAIGMYSQADTFLDIFTDGGLRIGDSSAGAPTNYVEISATGDVVFVGSSGLAYGEIYVKDNVNQTTLNSAAKVQVTDFDTNGASNNSTPDHTNDHITITKAGHYLCAVSVSLVNVAAQAHTVEMLLYKNNGATAFNNVHGHRDMAGGGSDEGSMSLSGIIDLAVNDTIELWADTDAAADRAVIFEDVTLSLVQIGGT